MDDDLIVSFSIKGEIDATEEGVESFCDMCVYFKCENLKKYLEDPPMHLIMYHCDDRRKKKVNEPTAEQLKDIATRSAEKFREYRNRKNDNKPKRSKKK